MLTKLRQRIVHNTKTLFKQKKLFAKFAKSSMWFAFGGVLGLFFFISFLFIFYTKSYTNFIYSGVSVDGIDFGGKTQDEVHDYFAKKNNRIQQTKFELIAPSAIATISAKQLDAGYNSDLLAQQAYSVGRSENTISNMSLILQAYLYGIRLPATFHYNDDALGKKFASLKKNVEVEPINAMFSFENGKVVTFRESVDGKTLDVETTKRQIKDKLQTAINATHPQVFTFTVATIPLKAEITTDKVNNLGIHELIGEGTSEFQHSIENRVYNISLAASRVNGALIPPGEVFSFTKTVGDISSLSGYKQAYVIENGKTVLGDGGGVCQVSTTLFRAALQAGLPIVERNQHAYRVGYYEQNSPPGIDAAVYSPSVDLKIKNDTGHYILVQSFVNSAQYTITFDLYGTKDDREVTMTEPVISSQTPAPPPVYQDDPTLPKGEVKQVDFSADGANVSFTRAVTKNGKPYLSDKFVSNYRPWQAIYMKGTKE